jgi:hypothetical protein
LVIAEQQKRVVPVRGVNATPLFSYPVTQPFTAFTKNEKSSASFNDHQVHKLQLIWL